MSYTLRSGSGFISRHHRLSIIATAIALILTALITSSGSANSQEVEKLNRFINQSNQTDKAMQLFSEARDLIDDDDWEGAEKAFRKFIDSYPKHKNVDAALYYMALSMKKQEKLEQAVRVIEWLLSQYPRSSWVDDAKNLRVEIAAQSGNGQVIEQELNKDDLETKVIALQALFQGNPARGAQIAAEMLKPDSNSNRRLKEIAVSLLGQYRSKEGIEMLLNLARNEKDARLRKSAVFWFAQSGGEEAVDELIKIYDADTNPEIRKQIIFALGQSQNARAAAKILELARAGDDESRKTAIFWLGQRRDEQSTDTLVQLYDGEKSETIKRQIIFSLAQITSKKALRKLFDIAKSDPSTSMRKQAIFWIGQSKDPEAVKFIEDILK